MAPGAARGAVAVVDVAEAPLDLGGGVGLPVVAGGGHLGAGKGLRDAVGAGGGVGGADVPARLLLPQRLEAGELVETPAVVAEHRLGDVLGVAQVDLDLFDTGDRANLVAGRQGGLLARVGDLTAVTRRTRQGGRLAAAGSGLGLDRGALGVGQLGEVGSCPLTRAELRVVGGGPGVGDPTSDRGAGPAESEDGEEESGLGGRTRSLVRNVDKRIRWRTAMSRGTMNRLGHGLSFGG